MKITGATLTRLSIAIALAFVVLVTSACDHKMSRFAAGHPLESTTVVDWQSKGEWAISITFQFRDDAPGYGCDVEAFNAEDESIGVVRAKPQSQDERVITMRLDHGRASDDVKQVTVTTLT